jgi:hypothetical protein
MMERRGFLAAAGSVPMATLWGCAMPGGGGDAGKGQHRLNGRQIAD